jgi:hypothetical protein
LYLKTGLDESGTGGAALKLILAASFSDGLKEEVMSIVSFFSPSCALLPAAMHNDSIVRKAKCLKIEIRLEVILFCIVIPVE